MNFSRYSEISICIALINTDLLIGMADAHLADAHLFATSHLQILVI